MCGWVAKRLPLHWSSFDVSETQRDLRLRLFELDQNEEFEASSWEAEFLESVLYNWIGPWTPAQEAKAVEILERYLP